MVYRDDFLYLLRVYLDSYKRLGNEHDVIPRRTGHQEQDCDLDDELPASLGVSRAKILRRGIYCNLSKKREETTAWLML